MAKPRSTRANEPSALAVKEAVVGFLKFYGFISAAQALQLDEFYVKEDTLRNWRAFDEQFQRNLARG